MQRATHLLLARLRRLVRATIGREPSKALLLPQEKRRASSYARDIFRHSTKQNIRSQKRLRKSAATVLGRNRQILCDRAHDNTYATYIPEASKRMLDNTVIPLTGSNSEVQGDTVSYTLALFDHAREFRARMLLLVLHSPHSNHANRIQCTRRHREVAVKWLAYLIAMGRPNSDP